jgi:hypothetical protein
VVLKTMLAKPVEFEGNVKIIDLFHKRPITRFLDQVSPLQSFGITITNPEHAFYVSIRSTRLSVLMVFWNTLLWKSASRLGDLSP